jgi:hypothetical protein
LTILTINRGYWAASRSSSRLYMIKRHSYDGIRRTTSALKNRFLWWIKRCRGPEGMPESLVVKDLSILGRI